MSDNQNEARRGDDVLMGAREMTEALKPELEITPAALSHHLKQGHLDSVRKFGGKYTTTRRKLRAEFGLEA